MLSAHVWQAALRLQYPVILIVPLLAAAMFGGRRALAFLQAHRRSDRHGIDRLALAGLLTLIIAPATAGAWIQGSLPPFDAGDPAFASRPDAFDRLMGVAKAVPPDAPLVVDEGLVAPLAGRARIRRLGSATAPPPGAYVLLDRNAWSPTYRLASLHERILLLLESTDRPVVADDGRFVLFGLASTQAAP
jgi:hypothetical protein